jgi:hypothetical protein
VAGNLNEAAKVHGVADVLFAHGVGPLLQLLQTSGPALAETFEQIGFGQHGHG